jgi:ubiquinone/menaquinone biosynthesis C-methylase UbiE
MDETHRLVSRQFSSTADAYAASTTHNDPAALAEIVTLADLSEDEVALDIATGPGTVALVFASKLRRAVALDLTASMLAMTAERAKKLELDNVSCVRGLAENLPFEDKAFDLVAVRTAPHHYADVRAAILEMARVAKIGGRVLIVDTTAPEDPELHRQLDEFERLRDPSHVRNQSPNEWRAHVEAAGLSIEFVQVGSHAGGKKIRFSEWVQRMNVPAPTVSRLRAILLEGDPDLRTLLNVETTEQDLEFTLPEITLLCRRFR